jgi:hypothetical protein
MSKKQILPRSCQVVPTLTGIAADSEAGPALAGPANGKVIFCHLTAVLRIQIRIGSGFNHVSGSGFGSRRATMTHKSRKIQKFHVLKCWLFSFEG